MGCGACARPQPTGAGPASLSQITRADGSTPQPPNVSYSNFEPSVRATPGRTEISSWRNVLNVSIRFVAHLHGDGVVNGHVDVAIPAAHHETVAGTDSRFVLRVQIAGRFGESDDRLVPAHRGVVRLHLQLRASGPGARPAPKNTRLVGMRQAVRHRRGAGREARQSQPSRPGAVCCEVPLPQKRVGSARPVDPGSGRPRVPVVGERAPLARPGVRVFREPVRTRDRRRRRMFRHTGCPGLRARRCPRQPAGRDPVAHLPAA